MLPLLFIVLIALSSHIQFSATLPNGAPESVCDSLLPFHGGGIEPMNTVAPFSIVPLQTVVEQGSVLRVEIQADPRELVFAGFMLHARTKTVPEYRVVGKFARAVDGSVRLINCDGEENTATHSNTNDKLDFGLDWQAPSDYVGEVYFIATVAQTYDKFWVGITSEPVRVVARGQGDQFNNGGISSTRRPFYQPTSPQFSGNPGPSSANLIDPFYKGCGDTKSCFGFPSNCINQQNCRAAVSTKVLGERYFFEMKTFGGPAAYVASALSLDDKMGNDSAIECVPEGGSVRAYSSWTYREPSFGVTRENVPQNIYKLIEGSYDNGQIYCRVERDAVSTVNGIKFDLIRQKYNVLVASGTANKANSVGYHDIGRDATAQAQSLAEVANFGSNSKLFIRLHGAFMLAAWIGCTSLGILLARYFKQTWVGSSICGKDIWFAWHRFLMFLTWALTVAGVVLIFLEIGEWSKVRNPHAILGIVVTIIAFLQPIGAFFRPHPGSKKRPVFNWLHWLGGNVAHIIAVVTIFFAVKLSKAELPEWMDYVLIVYVAFHVLMHLIFSIAGCVSDKRNTQRINSFPMGDVNGQRVAAMKAAEQKQDEPLSKLRRVLLGIYIIILLLITTVLILITVLAPIDQYFDELKSMMQS